MLAAIPGIPSSRTFQWSVAAIGFYLLLSLITLRHYIQFTSLSFIMGVIAIPIVLRCRQAGMISSRFGWLALIFLLLGFVLPVSTPLYFSICFALIFFHERIYGKASFLLPLTVLISSPAFQYLINSFSFPIRLHFTRLAGEIMNLMGYTVIIEGNLIRHLDRDYSVDPACMGLSMMTSSLLSGIILIAIFQIKARTQVSMARLFVFFAAVVLLNIASNLVRIILLVLFDVPSGSIVHELLGLACFSLYVLLPSFYLARFFAVRSQVIKGIEGNVAFIGVKKVAVHGFLFVGIALLGWRISKANTFSKFPQFAQEWHQEFKLTNPSPGVVKLENDNALVYIKYLRGWYDSEHHPMICWTGNGFEFKKVKEEFIVDRQMFTATITGGAGDLYTAWWYENSRTNTVKQMSWRMDMLRGSPPYAIINVASHSRESLYAEIAEIIRKKTLALFLK